MLKFHYAGSQGCKQLLSALLCFHHSDFIVIAVIGKLVDTGRLIDALYQTKNNSSFVKISLYTSN